MARASQNRPRGILPGPQTFRSRTPRRMAIDQLLKRHFWAVIVVLVAIAAFLDAQGIMHVVGASLGADETAARRAAARDAPARGAGVGDAPRDERRADPLAQPVRLGDRPAQRGAAAADPTRGRRKEPGSDATRTTRRSATASRSSSSRRRPIPTGRSRRSRRPRTRERAPSPARRRRRRQDGQVRRLGPRLADERKPALSGPDVQAAGAARRRARRLRAAGPRARSGRRRRRSPTTSRRASRRSARPSSTSTAASSTRSSRTRPS